MEQKNEGDSDSNLKAVDNFETFLATGLTQKNLAMKENSMVAKNEYRVKLTGKLDGFEETYGFSLYDIKVNIPPKAPSSDRCRVVPEIGKPLAKAFKVLFSKFCLDILYEIRNTFHLKFFINSLSRVEHAVKD